MVFKTTSTKPGYHAGLKAMTLVEMMVSVALGSLLALALCSLASYSSHSFVSLANYIDLDRYNRNAMDTLTREIRQAKRVISCSTNSISFEDYDGVTLTYSYSPGTRRLTRLKAGSTSNTNLLLYCDSLVFNVSQRNPVGGSYNVYPVATAGTAKVVDVTWRTSHSIFGKVANTEDVQTARVVIRKQGS